MGKFQDKVKNIYGFKCAISRKETSESCHLIPRHICHHLQLNNLINYQYNGIYLNRCLHNEFDQYFWTFDPHRLEWIDKNWVYLPIVIRPMPQRRSWEIEEYRNRTVRIPTKSLPFIWLHYQVFLVHNFTLMNFINNQQQQLYLNLLNSSEYSLITEDPDRLRRQLANNFFLPSMIITDRDHFNRTEYLVVDRLRPWTDQYWVPEDELDPRLINEYLELSSLKADPNYEPPTEIKPDPESRPPNKRRRHNF